MGTQEIRKVEVESLIVDLQDRYRTVTVEREPVEMPVDSFEEHRQYVEEGYNGGGYAWVVREPDDASELSPTTDEERDDRRRVLFHLPRSGDEWGLPGGGREPDETFEEATVREVHEETGIECEITDCWLLRHYVWESDDETDDRRAHTLGVFFDARHTDGSISIQPGESNGAAWFARLPERMLPANEFRAASWSP